MSRQDRELLMKGGWLQEIVKGWYLLVRPDLQAGDSSGWYANFWDFLSVYLSHYYGEEYCLSAENSLDLHLGKTLIPRQVVVMAPRGRGAPLELPFETSLLVYSSSDPLPTDRVKIRNLQALTLNYALCKVSPTFFQQQPKEAEIALQSIRNSDELLRVLVQHNFVRAAGRLIGAYRFLKSEKMANGLIKGLQDAHMSTTETNPFVPEAKPLLKVQAHQTPYVTRIFAMWEEYRAPIERIFPKPPGIPRDHEAVLERVEKQYSQDAYHSLSIEGYQVNKSLIEKVLNAKWNPDTNLEDRLGVDALAARGYYEAFQSVKTSLTKVFEGQSPGDIVATDLSDWYRKLFSPCVAAGILAPADLFGYRRHQVYIRNSRHTPFPAHALSESMDALFSCIKNEAHAGIRAVLGHFLFVFIHPYMGGNGRIGRFLMNVLLVAGGYPWTIIHVEKRREYLNSLESASCKGDIAPFAHFVRSELERAPS